MPLAPRRSARVVWEEGMYLTPQHFQAQRRHFEDVLTTTVEALHPFAHGLSGIAIDTDALAAGTLALVHARGVFRDGTLVSIPDIDAPPPPAALAGRFSPTRDAHVVYLALPAWRSDAPNVRSAAAPDGARFVELVTAIRDDTAGQDVADVPLAMKNLRLALDDELGPDDLALALAQVRRDGAGRFVLDRDYIPPCLQIGASDRLLALLGGLVAALESKGAALAASFAAPAVAVDGAPPSAYVGNEIATRWLLHAVRSAEGPLQHLLATRRCHPEQLWMELSRLAGALCTFSLSTQARDLPAYDHDDLGGCFGALERHLRSHLDLVVAARAIVVPLVRSSEVLHVGTVSDPRCYQPGARWFLGVRSSLGMAGTVARAPELLKVCASKFVLELVRRAYPGMTLEHVPAPPAGLAPKGTTAYFEIAMAGPCAQGLTESRELGVYVPDALAEVGLELAVLLPD